MGRRRHRKRRLKFLSPNERSRHRTRLANAIAKLTEEKTRLDAQLSNANFVERAPAEKVQELSDRQTEIMRQIDTLEGNVEALG